MIKRSWLLLLCVALLLANAPLSALSVEESIIKISKTLPGTLGVAALHIESGKRVEVKGEQLFPMASTSKLPVVLYVLSLVDSKNLDWNSKKKVTPYDIRSFCFIKPNQSLSVHELARLALEKSDNATPDMLLKMVGGTRVVTAWLHKQGFVNMRIDRSCLGMVADYCGIAKLGDEARCTMRHYNQCLKGIGKKSAEIAAKKFCSDKRDITTPRAMVDLLQRLFEGKLLSKVSTQRVFDCMKSCQWGKRRISYLLPKGTKVWHKTGSMDGIISDVGIVQLPRNKGHFAIAVYTNGSTAFKKQRELVIAKVAKTVFEHFATDVASVRKVH